jgi:hypothetical protein
MKQAPALGSVLLAVQLILLVLPDRFPCYSYGVILQLREYNLTLASMQQTQPNTNLGGLASIIHFEHLQTSKLLMM